MIKITNIRYSRVYDMILFFMDIDMNGGNIYDTRATALYVPSKEELQFLKIGQERILCTGLNNVIAYAKTYGSEQLSLKFEKILLDLEL